MDTTTSAQINSHQLNEIKFEIAQNYFSDILNGQLVIFSLIVAILIGLSWLYQRKINKDTVKNEVKREVDAAKTELITSVEQKQLELLENINTRLDQGNQEVNVLRGEVYRNMAQFWDSRNEYGTAFIWWLRAGYNFGLVSDHQLTKLCLIAARNSIQKIVSFFDINNASGEAQTLLKNIESDQYKVEKDLVYDAIKDAIKRTSSI